MVVGEGLRGKAARPADRIEVIDREHVDHEARAHGRKSICVIARVHAMGRGHDDVRGGHDAGADLAKAGVSGEVSEQRNDGRIAEIERPADNRLLMRSGRARIARASPHQSRAETGEALHVSTPGKSSRKATAMSRPASAARGCLELRGEELLPGGDSPHECGLCNRRRRGVLSAPKRARSGCGWCHRCCRRRWRRACRLRK